METALWLNKRVYFFDSPSRLNCKRVTSVQSLKIPHYTTVCDLVKIGVWVEIHDVHVYVELNALAG